MSAEPCVTLSLTDAMGWICQCGDVSRLSVLKGRVSGSDGDVIIYCGCGRTWRLTITEVRDSLPSE